MDTAAAQAPSARVATLTEEEIPVALNFYDRMMAESGMAPLLADDWREITRALYAEGYRAGTITHFGWLADGVIVATPGVMVRDDFSAYTFKSRRYGWIMDVYVLPEHRRHGHARRLTQETLTWLRAKSVVFARLVASEQAQQTRLYERLGFTFANEMRLNLAGPVG